MSAEEPDMSWQGDYLPSFGAETNISFYEFPHDYFLVGEQLGITAELLSKDHADRPDPA